MLILAIPSVSLFFGEPEMNDRLIVNINIYIKTIGEYMMCVVLMAPPLRAKAQDDLSKNDVEEDAGFPSTVTIIMTEPSCLFYSKS